MSAAEKLKPNARTVNAVVANPEARRTLEEWARAHGGKVHFINDKAAWATLAADASAVAVVEAGDDSEAVLTDVETFVSHAASRSDVVVLLHKQSGAATRRLFKAGAKDVLTAPLNAADLATALKPVVSERPAASNAVAGKVICVLKTAGGIGGTMISANIARECTRLGIGEIALFDLDMQFGGVDTALDFAPPLNLTDAIVAGDRLDAGMLRQMMSEHASGVRALASSKTIAPMDSMGEQFAANLCNLAKATFSVSIIDMPMAWAPWFASVLASSDVIVPVVEPTVRSAKGAMRIASALEDLGIRAPAKTIVPVANRSNKSPNPKERLKMLEDILKAPCTIQIREDLKTCSEAEDVGRCLRDVAPAAAVTTDLETAARTIAKAAGFDISKAEPETTQRFALPWRRA
jgi:pilus assembly protein CpaE